MTTAIALRSPDWTPEQTELIKRTVAPQATNDELAMFLHVCKVSGLDPLQRQIWFLKRNQKMRDGENEIILDPQTGKPRWETKVSIMAAADGLQARALRFPDCTGIRYAAVYEKDIFLLDRKSGEVKKHWSNPFISGKCVGAWACVDREGKAPFFVVVHMSEYLDARGAVWKSKPVTMIEKVARATALRRAYPENFGGIYDEAEIAEGDGRPELPPHVAPIAAASNVSQLPPLEQRQPAAASEPRVDLDPAEDMARAMALTAKAAKAQSEQDEADADLIDLRARALKTGIPPDRFKVWVETMLGRQLPNENRWNRGVTKTEREILRDELRTRIEFAGKDIPGAQPKSAPKLPGKRGPIVDTPPPKKLVPNGDGSLVPTPA